MTLQPGALPEGLDLTSVAQRLTGISGVCGVTLGGSRARGEHSPSSDVDLGLYYRGTLDVVGLRTLARELAGPDAEVTERGEWGRWVDGGGWLVIDGVHVDWLYRDLERVRASWVEAHRGAYRWNSQAGHPLGVPDFAYVAELALGVVLADPTGELAALQAAVVYPEALTNALVSNLWEADFLLGGVSKACEKEDTAYVALCLARVMLICAHALHGHDRRWLVNEKGAIASAGRLPSAPPSFTDRAHKVLANVGTRPDQLVASIEQAQAIVNEVRTVCATTR